MVSADAKLSPDITTEKVNIRTRDRSHADSNSLIAGSRQGEHAEILNCSLDSC